MRMSRHGLGAVACWAAVMLALLGVLLDRSVIDARAAEPLTQGGSPAFRRLNEIQYKAAITDVFGPSIVVPGRFEPGLREGGLLAIGESKADVTPTGFEQYEDRARRVAAQVLSKENRSKFVDCPAIPEGFDVRCARRFLTKYGRLLLRRPLERAELTEQLALARAIAARTRDFDKGLQASLTRMLVSPFFIFRVETGPAAAGEPASLDAYSLASRLSFLFWNSGPDDALLDAAAGGNLSNDADLEREVDRLIASPKFERGVRAYFWDMFGYNQFGGLSKEQVIYPKFVSQLAKDAEEQNLRTIVDFLVRKQGDYRDLFTTRSTFLNRRLASLYRVPLTTAGFDGWTSYTFAEGSNRQGLLTFAGFLMLDPSHEGRSSPTNRGKFVREALLCQKVPPPPPAVNFAIVQDIANPVYKTARERLKAHQENPACAGCHALTDPIGLSMENYDAIGAFRSTENGQAIDPRGRLSGKAFADLVEMQVVLRNEPSLTSCLTQRVFEYGVGRAAEPSETGYIEYIQQQFADSSYRVPALMRAIALSKTFRNLASGRPAIQADAPKKGNVHG